jgi:hypothetical protein
MIDAIIRAKKLIITQERSIARKKELQADIQRLETMR